MITQPIQENKVYTNIWDIKSGEFCNSYLELPTIQDPQKIGSAISYYRRYTLASLLAIQAEDDDANKASKPTPIKPIKKPLLKKDGFEYLISKGTKEEIQKAINEREIPSGNLTELKAKLK